LLRPHRFDGPRTLEILYEAGHLPPVDRVGERLVLNVEADEPFIRHTDAGYLAHPPACGSAVDTHHGIGIGLRMVDRARPRRDVRELIGKDLPKSIGAGFEGLSSFDTDGSHLRAPFVGAFVSSDQLMSPVIWPTPAN
jgi:hypothetical protein